MGPDAVIFVVWMLSFKPAFSRSSFISRGFLAPLHSLPLGWCHLHIWGNRYFSWHSSFQLESSIPAFHMMYSAYKLNKQSDNIQPWCIPFPILNQSIDPGPVLAVAFWPECRFLKEAGQVIWYSHLFKDVPQFVAASQCLYHFASPPVMNENSCCFTFLSTLGIVIVLNFGHSNRCVVVSYLCFGFHFSDDIWYGTPLHILIYHPYIFFVEVPIKAFGPCFNWVVCVLTIEF